MTTQGRVKLKVVDADGHYMEPEDLRPWVEGKFKEVAPHRVVDENGNLQWGGRDWWTEGMSKSGNVVFRRSEEAKKGLVVGQRDEVDPKAARQGPSAHANMPTVGIDSDGNGLAVWSETDSEWTGWSLVASQFQR